MLRRVSLPNQLEIWAPNTLEATVLHREIVTESTYLSHGITLHAGAIVFDVGANIGLFSVHLARTVPGVQLHAFEPIPLLFDALRRNLDEHARGARATNVGLSDRHGEATFEVDRFMTVAATMQPEVFTHAATKAPATAWLAAGLADLELVSPSRVRRLLAGGLARPAWRPLVMAIMVPVTAVLALRRWIFLQRPRCRLETLSAVIAESGVPRIDLVKIDVEGAEEQVIAGIGDEDWPRIRQLVIEVHDIGGRLDRLTRLLEDKGFVTVRARESWAMHELLRLSTLYAVRHGG